MYLKAVNSSDKAFPDSVEVFHFLANSCYAIHIEYMGGVKRALVSSDSDCTLLSIHFVLIEAAAIDASLHRIGVAQ